MVFQAVNIPTHKCLGDVDFGRTGDPDFHTFNQSKCTARQCIAMLHCDWSKVWKDGVPVSS